MKLTIRRTPEARGSGEQPEYDDEIESAAHGARDQATLPGQSRPPVGLGVMIMKLVMAVRALAFSPCQNSRPGRH